MKEAPFHKTLLKRKVRPDRQRDIVHREESREREANEVSELSDPFLICVLATGPVSMDTVEFLSPVIRGS